MLTAYMAPPNGFLAAAFHRLHQMLAEPFHPLDLRGMDCGYLPAKFLCDWPSRDWPFQLAEVD